jgi:hypothetical protein
VFDWIKVIEVMESDLTDPKIHEVLVEHFTRHLKLQDGCDMETIDRCVRIFVDSSFFLGIGLEPKKKFAANILAAYTDKYCKNFGVKIESSSEEPCNVDPKVSIQPAKDP